MTVSMPLQFLITKIKLYEWITLSISLRYYTHDAFYDWLDLFEYFILIPTLQLLM